MASILKVLLKAIGARACYSTRVWTILAFPLLAGTVLGWSTARKVEGVLLGMLVAICYSLARWVDRD